MSYNLSKITRATVLAAGLLLSAFAANAATIFMTPPLQLGLASSTVFVDIWANGLPEGTVGGALDISWTGDMTLDSVFYATPDLADNGGGAFPGNWDPVSSFFTGCDSGCNPGDTSISGLYVGSFDGLMGNQAVARLTFATGAGFSGSEISMGAAALGGTWSSWISGEFTNDYTGATIDAVPVPAALWLFGSGLAGLFGATVRRRRV